MASWACFIREQRVKVGQATFAAVGQVRSENGDKKMDS